MNQAEEVRKELAYLAGLARFGVVPTLDRMQAMLAALGHPERAFPAVHVAGTNGKGSTSRLIAAALQSAGYRTGLFTSPHLIRYNERIMLQGAEIADGDLCSLLRELRPLAERVAQEVGHPTEFEMSTVLAFLYFARVQVDVAVVEVGMGGTWDSTNVITPVLSVITPVSMDHMARLGDTLPEIASQKAGIIKPQVPVVLAPQDPAALEVLLGRADELAAPVIQVVDGGEGAAGRTVATIRLHRWDAGGGYFDLTGPHCEWLDLHVALLGRHQITNAGVAAAACQVLSSRGFKVGEQDVRQALATTKWPGRLEILRRDPIVVLDGAHNEAGVAVLAAALKELFTQRPLNLVLGMGSDKSVAHILPPVLALADVVYCTTAASARTPGFSPEVLAAQVEECCRAMGREIRVEPVHGAWQAYQKALAETPPTGVVCVCGSLYMMGEVRGAWLAQAQEMGKPLP